jgi:hypothetical protein
MPFIIVDPGSRDQADLYAFEDVFEGWAFTWLPSQAKGFDTREEALEAIHRHFPGREKLLTVRAVPS